MVKLPLKSYGVGTGKTLKYFWPLFNIMHEKVKHCQVEPIYFINWNQRKAAVLFGSSFTSFNLASSQLKCFIRLFKALK